MTPVALHIIQHRHRQQAIFAVEQVFDSISIGRIIKGSEMMSNIDGVSQAGATMFYIFSRVSIHIIASATDGNNVLYFLTPKLKCIQFAKAAGKVGRAGL
jgi:hypothetical protein